MKIDLGRKSEITGQVIASEPEKNRVYYPSFYVDNPTKDFPTLEVGETIKAVVELKVKSMSMNESEGSKMRKSCSFDVLSMEIKDTKGPKSDDDIEDALNSEMNSKEKNEEKY